MKSKMFWCTWTRTTHVKHCKQHTHFAEQFGILNLRNKHVALVSIKWISLKRRCQSNTQLQIQTEYCCYSEFKWWTTVSCILLPQLSRECCDLWALCEQNPGIWNWCTDTDSDAYSISFSLSDYFLLPFSDTKWIPKPSGGFTSIYFLRTLNR